MLYRKSEVTGVCQCLIVVCLGLNCDLSLFVCVYLCRCVRFKESTLCVKALIVFMMLNTCIRDVCLHASAVENSCHHKFEV